MIIVGVLIVIIGVIGIMYSFTNTNLKINYPEELVILFGGIIGFFIGLVLTCLSLQLMDSEANLKKVLQNDIIKFEDNMVYIEEDNKVQKLVLDAKISYRTDIDNIILSVDKNDGFWRFSHVEIIYPFEKETQEYEVIIKED